MNCTELDATSTHLREAVVGSDGGFAVACVVLALPSLLLLAAGEQLMRTLSALTAGVGGGVAVFVITEAVRPPVACETRLVVAAIAGVGAAVLAVCVVRTGLFVLGAAGFGVVTHLVYDSLPLDGSGGDLVLLGRPIYYYLAMAAMILLGAVVGALQRREFVRISSSLLGAGGMTLLLHLAVERAGGRVPPIALLVVLVACTVGGVAVQWRRAARGRSKRAAREGRDAGGGSVPVGLPIVAA